MAEIGNLTILENIMNKKLSSVHTAFLAKVISFKETTADIQPLQNGAPILPNTPVALNARYKLTEQTLDRLVNGNNGCKASVTGNVSVSGTAPEGGGTVTSTGTMSANGTVTCSCKPQNFINLVKTPLQAGDIVICVCCESTISTAKKGEMPSSSEPIDNHSLSNSVVVGIL